MGGASTCSGSRSMRLDLSSFALAVGDSLSSEIRTSVSGSVLRMRQTTQSSGRVATSL